MKCEEVFLFLLFFPFARDFFLEILAILEALDALETLEVLEILERLDFLVSRIISFSPISFFQLSPSSPNSFFVSSSAFSFTLGVMMSLTALIAIAITAMSSTNPPGNKSLIKSNGMMK